MNLTSAIAELGNTPKKQAIDIYALKQSAKDYTSDFESSLDRRLRSSSPLCLRVSKMLILCIMSLR